ncbi:MAG TPA: CBS domain-containing protein [Vicinamibacterales bacterium]|nr:CBS domain-containing protein [Vicinamibacterales bacterium]
MADLALARRVLETEAAAILALVPRIDARFDRAIALLHECRGRVLLTGMGKSGIVCRKMVRTDTRMRDVIYEMSRKGLGMTCVANDAGDLLGIITDGDLRRLMERAPGDALSLRAADVMTSHPATVEPRALAAQALNILEQRKITALVVATGSPARAVGVVHLHDLWRTEMV